MSDDATFPPNGFGDSDAPRREKKPFVAEGFDATTHLQDAMRPDLTHQRCKRCGEPYFGFSPLPLCPLCEGRALVVHLRKLQDRMVALDRERTDLRGQIESCLRNFRSRALAPKGVCETITCFLCDVPCPDLYAQLADHTICQECAIRSGMESYVDDTNAEKCPHEVSIFRCRACRAERVRERDAREASIEREARERQRTARAPRRKAPPVNLDEIEEI